MPISSISPVAASVSLARGRRFARRRRGAVAVLAAILMVVMLGMLAFAVDLGYLTLAKTEAQRTADAAAHAAVLEFARNADAEQAIDTAQVFSTQYAANNSVLGSAAALSLDNDVVIGHYDFDSGDPNMSFGDPATFNAVRVRIRRTSSMNGEVPFFFAQLLGTASQGFEVTATAALVRNVSGFRTPPGGGNVPMLPITISEETWDDSIRYGVVDTWNYDADTQTVWPGADGIPEAILFPNRTGSSGNLGTVNIGVSNNSASYLGNQIRHGLSHSDLEFHGGSLELDDSGQLELTGNPGLSASVKDDVEAIVGLPRIIPLYRKVQGNGNNAVFTIVRFVGVRVMHVQLTGGVKMICVQPASTIFDGVIQGETLGSSDQVYSPPRLVN